MLHDGQTGRVQVEEPYDPGQKKGTDRKRHVQTEKMTWQFSTIHREELEKENIFFFVTEKNHRPALHTISHP